MNITIRQALFIVLLDLSFLLSGVVIGNNLNHRKFKYTAKDMETMRCVTEWQYADELTADCKKCYKVEDGYTVNIGNLVCDKALEK